MPGSGRCSSHQGLAGRKTNLTQELADQLTTIIAAGNYLSVACRAVGLPRSTFILWMQRGTSEAEADAPFRAFREQVEKATAKGEVRNVATIAKAATESWQAAAWLLERGYPDRWGKAPVRLREETAEVEGPDLTETSDPFEEVDELARKRATRSAV
jgi:hypothetical protein